MCEHYITKDYILEPIIHHTYSGIGIMYHVYIFIYTCNISIV